MNKTCQIVWAGIAENDLKGIIEYIAIDNPSNALKILQKAENHAFQTGRKGWDLRLQTSGPRPRRFMHP